MRLSFEEALEQLKVEGPRVCNYLIASAWFLDEKEQHSHLDDLFSQAVVDLTTTLGDPISERCLFPGRDVQRVTCWNRDDKIVYAMLEYGDNTRIRLFTLGVARRDSVQVIKPDSTAVWWER